MARERMITRTVTELTAKVMCVDVETAQVSVVLYVLTGNYEDNEQILKTLKKLRETDNFKLIKVEEVETKEKLYGMKEQQFIELAKELPPRTVK